MKPAIIKRNIGKEFYTDERCFIIEAVNFPDDEIMSIAEARVEPGVTTSWHYLDGIDERYLIISGRGRMEIGKSSPVMVSSGDVVMIPAGAAQRITNTGGADLVFFCICTPGFTTERYRNMEKT